MLLDMVQPEAKNRHIDHISREVSAPLDRVWEIVADVYNESKSYSGVHIVKNISKNGNVIEREVSYGGRFLKVRGRNRVVLNPKTSVEVANLHCPVVGTRIVTLFKSDDNNKTKVNISLDLDDSGVPFFLRNIARRRTRKSIEIALNKLAEEVEQ